IDGACPVPPVRGLGRPTTPVAEISVSIDIGTDLRSRHLRFDGRSRFVAAIVCLMNASTLRDAMAAHVPTARQHLERLVRIPSVSFPEFDQSNVRRSAEATAEILEASGL